MKRLLLICHLMVALACAAWADTNIRILQVGLNGRCVPYRPCSVLVSASNPYPTLQDFELQVRLRFAPGMEQFDAQQTYIHHLTLGPREVREIDAPIEPSRGGSIVDVTLRLPEGKIVDRDSVDAKERMWTRGKYLVGVLCREESVCKGIQAQIQLGGSPKDRESKNQNLELAMELRQRSQWWSYAPASIIVVAIQASSLRGDERSALEWFARGGGSLVLLEQVFADPTFLAGYRQPAGEHNGVAIGSGRLYRISRLSGDTLGGVFSGEELELLVQGSRASWSGYELNSLRGQYATSFGFPKLADRVDLARHLHPAGRSPELCDPSSIPAARVGMAHRRRYRLLVRLCSLLAGLAPGTAAGYRRLYGHASSRLAQQPRCAWPKLCPGDKIQELI